MFVALCLFSPRVNPYYILAGIKVLFRCGTVILKIALGKTDILKQLPGMYETLNYLKHFDLKHMDPGQLIQQV